MHTQSMVETVAELRKTSELDEPAKWSDVESVPVLRWRECRSASPFMEMKFGNHGKNQFLLAALIAGLALMLAGQGRAQTFKTLHSFSGSSDGAYPTAALILSSSKLYGTSGRGGTSGAGVVFSVSTNGTGFTVLHSFTGGSSDGATPYAGLIISSNTLYGTTVGGGSSGAGTVFKLNTDGTGFKVLYSFTQPTGSSGFLRFPTNSDGSNPSGSLILSSNTLFGTAFGGGSSGQGTVFALNVNGTEFKVLHTFTGGSDRGGPEAGLILSGNTLIGTAYGQSGLLNGAVFALNTNGTGFTTLHAFTGGSDGANPRASLVLWSNKLYGVAQPSGNSGEGSVFRVDADGNGFTNLHSFTAIHSSTGTNSEGAWPWGLIVVSNTLYVTTSLGGNSGQGTVFAVNIDGTGFGTVNSFTALDPTSETNGDGANPLCGLIVSGNTLYGTATHGGSSGKGTVFGVSLIPVSRPQVTAIHSRTNVILTWPTNATGFSLQSTTNLASPVWTTNSAAPVVVNGQHTVTNPISGTQQFFRLSQ